MPDIPIANILNVIHANPRLITAYILGLFLQGYIMLSPITDLNTKLKAFLLPIVISLLVFFPKRHEVNYVFIEHYAAYPLFFMVFFSVLNSSKIIPNINEYSLILFNTVFIYYFFSQYPWLLTNINFNHPETLIINSLVLIPTVAVLLNGLISARPPMAVKVLFYVWYLVMATILLFFIILPKTHDVLIEINSTAQPYLSVISLGMISLCLSINFFSIYQLLPIPSKHQTMSERLKELKIYLQLLNSKYIDQSLNPLETILFVMIIFAILSLNFMIFHLNDLLLINIIFLSGHFILRGKSPSLIQK